MKLNVAIIIFFIAFVVSCTGLKGVSSSNSSTTTAPAGVAAIEGEIHILINRYRQSKGLPPLKYHGDIMAEARQHSTDMAEGKVTFGHDGFEIRARRLQGKIAGFRGVAENVAYGQRTAAEVVDGWIKSQGHRVNIESNY